MRLAAHSNIFVPRQSTEMPEALVEINGKLTEVELPTSLDVLDLLIIDHEVCIVQHSKMPVPGEKSSVTLLDASTLAVKASCELDLPKSIWRFPQLVKLGANGFGLYYSFYADDSPFEDVAILQIVHKDGQLVLSPFLNIEHHPDMLGHLDCIMSSSRADGQLNLFLWTYEKNEAVRPMVVHRVEGAEASNSILRITSKCWKRETVRTEFNGHVAIGSCVYVGDGDSVTVYDFDSDTQKTVKIDDAEHFCLKAVVNDRYIIATSTARILALVDSTDMSVVRKIELANFYFTFLSVSEAGEAVTCKYRDQDISEGAEAKKRTLCTFSMLNPPSA